MMRFKKLGCLLILGLFLAIRAPIPGLSQGNSCGISGACKGNITTNGDAVILPVPQDTATIVVTVAGTWTGTLQFQQSSDSASTWHSSSGNPQPSGTGATFTTANGQWRFVGSGLTNFQVIASATISGTANVTITPSKGSAASGGSGCFSGGDLTGCSPNPTVANANGVPLPTLAGQSGYLLDTNGTLSLNAGIAVAHNLLSATHSDTTPAAVERGAIITGQGVNPTWAKLLAGVQYQSLVMGVAEPGWGALDLSQAAAVTNNLGTGHGGTGAATAAAALVNLLPAGTRVGDMLYCTTYAAGACSAWTLLAGNTTSTAWLQETAGGVASWTVPPGAAPAGSGSEVQYRSSASAFGAVTGSSFSAGALTLPKIIGTASTTAAAAFNIPSGVAPTTGLGTGDLWNLSGILQFYDGTNTQSVATIQTPSVNGNYASFSGTGGLLQNSGYAVGNAVNFNGAGVSINIPVLATNGSGQLVASTGHQVSVPLACVAGGGSHTAYTCTTAPTFAPVAGDEILFKADVANTGASTLVVNAQAGTPAIDKQGGATALSPNDLLAGQYVFMIFDGTNWTMQGQSGNGIGGALQVSANTLNNTNTTSQVLITGGNDASSAGTVGPLNLRGGNQTGTGGASSQGGSAWLHGGNNAGTNAGSQAGNVEIIGGESTAGGKQGLQVSGAWFAKGVGTSTPWNLQCLTTAMTVNDCGASPGNWLGIAALVHTSSVEVIFPTAETLVNASAAVTLGDTVCAGSTAGQVTDSGGTSTCTATQGSQLGVVIATSGTWTLPDGTTFTPTTTLPLIAVQTAVRALNMTGATDTILMGNDAGVGSLPAYKTGPSGGTTGCAGATDTPTYNTSTHAWGCHQITPGTGTVTASGTPAQYDFPYWTTATNLTKITAPTTKGKFSVGYNLPTDAAAAPSVMQVGYGPPRGVTGTTSTDTVLFTDCNSGILFQTSVAVGETLPTATTLENAACNIQMDNRTTGSNTAVTVTPATWQISKNGGTPGATLTIDQGQSCFVYVIPTGAGWDANCHNATLVAGTGIALTRAPDTLTIANTGVTSVATAAPLSGGPITSTGTLSCPTCLTGPNVNTVGGIIGTDFVQGVQAASRFYAWFASGQASNQQFVSPLTVWLSNFTALVYAVPSPSNYSSLQTGLAVTTGNTVSLPYWTVPGSTAAGAVASSADQGLRPLLVPQGLAISIPANGVGGPLLSSYTAEILGSTAQILGTNLNAATVGTGAIVYTSFSQSTTPSATETTVEVPVPWTLGGTAKNLCWYQSTANGAGGALTVTLRQGVGAAGALGDTTLTQNSPLSMGLNNAYCDYYATTSHSVALAQGDRITLGLVNGNASAASGAVEGFSMQVDPNGLANGWIIFGLNSSTLPNASATYLCPFTNRQTITITSASAGMPDARVAVNLIGYCTAAPGTEPATFTLYKNGSPTSIVATILTAFSAPGEISDLYASTGHSVAYAAKDIFTLKYNQLATGTAPTCTAFSLETASAAE